MFNEKNLEMTLSIIAQNFLSASEMVNNVRMSKKEMSIALLRIDLDDAIVKAETALESLKSFRNTLD